MNNITLVSYEKKQADSGDPVDGYSLVTPMMAQYWLANFNYKHQRAIRQWHVANLAVEMTAGRFREKTQINFCLLDGQYILTNGQHTLSAIIKSGVPWLLSVVVRPVFSDQDVADDFARHDTHLTRQLGDSLVAHEENIRLGITVTEMQWVSAACAYYAMITGDNTKVRQNKSITHDEKLSLIRKHGDLATNALRVIPTASSKKRGFATRKTTLACMMLVYSRNEDGCHQFYGEMFRDDGLKIGDPRKTLLEYFMDTATISGTPFSGQKRGVPDHAFVKAQATAWNAFYGRRQLKLIKIDHEARQVVFNGIGTVSV